METSGQADCLKWLLQASYDLFASREVEPLSTAITDAFLTLTGADRAYLLLCEAGPDNLLAVGARGPGGLVITSPDRRVLAAAKSLLKDGAAARVHETQGGRAMALAMLPAAGVPTGVLFADGHLKEHWAETSMLEAFARSAGLALDNARLLERASNDLLTGLPNNSYFMQAVDKALRVQKEDLAGGILLLDLDNFKRVNASAGRDVGDRALLDVAHTLRDTLSADGLVARFGSDKFGVLLGAEAKNRVHLRLRDVAERARAAVGAKVYGGVQLSVCIGGLAFCASRPGAPKPTAQEALSQCDKILSKIRAVGMAQLEIVVPVSD